MKKTLLLAVPFAVFLALVASVALAVKPGSDRAPPVDSFSGVVATAHSSYGTNGPFFQGIACNDGSGSKLYPVACDTAGQLKVVGGTGSSSTTVQGSAADGAAVVGSPVRIGGKDGSGNTQDILTDTTGLVRFEGSAAAAGATGGTWSTPVTVACTASTASSATLTAGQTYEITSDIDMFIRPAASSTTSWRPLWAKTYLYARQVATGGGAGVIACITATGSGTLYLTPVTSAE